MIAFLTTRTDFKDVAALVAGESRWRQYIGKNIEVANDSIKTHIFKIVSSSEFEKLGQDSEAAGITYKQSGTITLVEYFGVNSRAAFLVAALHEFVHLVSHPAKQGVSQSSAKGFLGEGLHEGLAQVVTEDILAAQKIAPSKHKEYEAPVSNREEAARHYGYQALWQRSFPRPDCRLAFPARHVHDPGISEHSEIRNAERCQKRNRPDRQARPGVLVERKVK